MSATAIEQGNVRCGICKEFIPGVFAKSSALMTALNHPDKWDDEIECLVCAECQTSTIKAKAWMKHAGMPTCVKVEGRGNP